MTQFTSRATQHDARSIRRLLPLMNRLSGATWPRVAIGALAFAFWVHPVKAQSVADTVQLLTLAVTGFRSPNGPIIGFTRKTECLGLVHKCDGSETATDLSPVVSAGVAKALHLPVAADSAEVSCPWSGGGGARAGVVLAFGLPRIVADTAYVHVGLSCSAARRGFYEGGVVIMRRREGSWTVFAVRDHFIT